MINLPLPQKREFLDQMSDYQLFKEYLAQRRPAIVRASQWSDLPFKLFFSKSLDSSLVRIVTRLRAGRPEFDFRQGQGISLFQTGSEGHPASYPTGTRDSFSGGKAA